MKKRSLLMIPGPIEFEPDVLSALGEPTTSHLAPDYGRRHTLEQMRQVFANPSGQPWFWFPGAGDGLGRG
jgi:alanine-glyoxylate transaminase/serine-glyoxylate transaminase/serine-pyruvate transaminase